MRAIFLGLGLILAVAMAVPAAKAQSSDAPRVENARVEKKTLAAPLAAEVKAWATKAEGPQWLGYAVPQMGRERMMCCGDYDGSWRNGCGHCRLEDRDNGTNMTSRDEAGTAKLGTPPALRWVFTGGGKHANESSVVWMDRPVD